MVATVNSQGKIKQNRQKALILWFEEVSMADVSLVGSKNASLGEMIQQLTPQGINVPGGFAITAYAYQYFIQQAGLEDQLRQIFRDLDVEDLDNLRSRSKRARALILDTPFPPELAKAIIAAYRQLCERYDRFLGFSNPEFSGLAFSGDDYLQNFNVAVRSSTTIEDLPDASFTGQQETYLNVYGVQSVLESCHKCFASLFTDQAISYRAINDFDHFEVSLSISVQQIIRSDLATSGVIFSIDTETGFKNAALITAAYGLGENVVRGAVNPDEYIVFKPTLNQGYSPILSKHLGSKKIKMVYDIDNSKLTKNVSTSSLERNQFAINDDEILQLVEWACQIEDHYSQIHNRHTSMDIEKR